MEYRISRRAALLAPSLTLAITAKAKELRAAGEDVVGFGAGEPDFDTPEHIKDAAVQALADGFTKYTPASGTPELRQAVAEKFANDNELEYDPAQIIVSCGGKHSCYNVILAVCQSGDEVIIPAPFWLSYPEMVKLAGATPVILETTDETEFKMTPDQLREAINENTRLVILNSPSNPTGSVYTPEETKAIGDVCVEKGVMMMSDEIYEKLIYGDTVFKSVASFSKEHQEHTIIVHGLAKAYSMTGWRIGFTAAPLPIAKAPFYAIRIQGSQLIGWAGLAVDSQLRVIRQDGSAIPNLYAAGELLGTDQFMGRSYCGGMLVTPALTFGRLLGDRMLSFSI